MLVAGDELGRTQLGNNNAYCQDNEISWVAWPYDRRDPAGPDPLLVPLVSGLLRLRRRSPVLRRTDVLSRRPRAAPATWTARSRTSAGFGPTAG